MKLLNKILAIIRGDCNIAKLKKIGLKIGANYSIARNCEIDYSHAWLIEIGDNATITSGCKILAHDASTKRDLDYAKIGCVKIGSNVFIGVNSIILPNTEIGDNVVIGAGSIVSGKIDANSVYVGCPAKKVMSKNEFLNKHKEKMKSTSVYDENCTISKITDAQKQEMKKAIKGKIGYVK